MYKTYLEGKIDCTPEDAGYDKKAINKIDNLFTRLIDEEKLQGASYLLSLKGKVFVSKSIGSICGFEDRGPLKTDSIRRIASITKMFTATAILQLIEEGKLYLLQPVSDFIEEFNTDYHKKINIFHLLTHTSGMIADPGYFLEPYKSPMNFTDNWIKDYLTGPPQAEPGTQWNYSSRGFRILGEIIQRITGIKFENYISENILKPLGLNRTFFNVPENLYNEVLHVDINDEEKMKNCSTIDGSPNSSGGLYSTLYDLQKFGQLMLNKGEIDGVRILGRKTIEAMTKNQLNNIPAFSWGLKYKAYEMGFAWRITNRNNFCSPGTFSHEGTGRIALYIDPLEEFIAVWMVPSHIGWVPESILNPMGVMWSGIL